MLIITTGMPGSGKEELLKVLQSRGLDIVRMGDTVRDDALNRGIQRNAAGIGNHADAERKRNGPTVWAERTLKAVDEKYGLANADKPLAGRTFVIDGCRSLAEVDYFKKNHKGEVFIIAVHTSPTKRFARLVRRGRSDDPYSREDFDVRDLRELGWGIGGVIAIADHMLLNEGALDHFRKDVTGLVNRLVPKQK